MDKKPDHAPVILNPFLIYIALAVVAVLLQRVLPLPFLPVSAARVAGVGIMILNLIVGLPAVRRMLQAKTPLNPARPSTSLVLSGPSRLSRNPMYIGLTLLYTGMVTFLGLPWGLILLPLVVWLITRWVIIPEEKYLEDKFGEQYLTYKSTVRRWI